MANTSTPSNKKQSPKATPKFLTWPFVIVAAAAYIFRAQEYILKPQLYAEDGYIWLADAYNKGLSSLVLPLNSFFHLPERLFGLVFVSVMPLQFAPVVFNLTALGIFCLMVYYLFTPRTRILDNLYQKLFVLGGLCLIANVDEFFFNFSNSIFLLGIIGVLIMVAQPAKNRFVNGLEKTLFALTCFTLPFAWFFLLFALFEKFKNKTKGYFFLATAATGAVTQLVAYLTSEAERSVVTVQSLASKHTLIEIHNQIIVPAVRFARLDYVHVPYLPARANALVFISSVLVVVVAAIIVLKNSNKQVRYLLLFIALMTAAALKSPYLPSNSAIEVIKFMSTATGGDRYFIFGIIGTAIIIAKLSDKLPKQYLKYGFLSLFMLAGLATSIHTKTFYVEKNFVDYRSYYKAGIEALKQPNRTDPVVIPENPNGWSITLYPNQ